MKLKVLISFLALVLIAVGLEVVTAGGALPVRMTLLKPGDIHQPLEQSRSEAISLSQNELAALRIEPRLPVFKGSATVKFTLEEGAVTVYGHALRESYSADDWPVEVALLIRPISDEEGQIYIAPASPTVRISAPQAESLNRHQTIWPTSLSVFAALLVFVPIAMLIGAIRDDKIRARAVLGASLAFIALLSLSLLLVFAVLVLAGYALVRSLAAGRIAYWPTVGAVVLALAAFKVVGPIGVASLNLNVTTLWLPIGLSYFAARQIDLATKVASRQVVMPGPFDYCVYCFYWPSFSAGPITEYNEFSVRNPSYPAWPARAIGLRRIGSGMVKKIAAEVVFTLLIAGQVADVLVHGTATPHERLAFYFGNMLFVFLDFSGYTDMAVGTARLMGARLPENFDRPLLRWNMRLFWRHWHMSLTRWVSRTVFMPISMAVRRQPKWFAYLVPLFATTLTIGLWHGFQLGWLLWGIHHGFGVIISDRLIAADQWLGRRRWILPQHGFRVLGVLFVWSWLSLSYTFTLSSNFALSLSEYGRLLMAIVTLGFWG